MMRSGKSERGGRSDARNETAARVPRIDRLNPASGLTVTTTTTTTTARNEMRMMAVGTELHADRDRQADTIEERLTSDHNTCTHTDM
jgi:hypothetical protein